MNAVWQRGYTALALALQAQQDGGEACGEQGRAA